MTERGDRRRKLIAVLPHCLLNQNTVVKHLASHEGAVVDLVKVLVEEGYGLIQLPCPETIYLGLKRWWMSKDQYDTESYRKMARSLLEPYVTLLKELVKDGCRYIVLGVKGSPSCALEVTSGNPEWGGEPNVGMGTMKVKGMGVFMEEFLKLIAEHSIPEPMILLDVDHREIAEKGLPEELEKRIRELSRFLEKEKEKQQKSNSWKQLFERRLYNSSGHRKEGARVHLKLYTSEVNNSVSDTSRTLQGDRRGQCVFHG
ncbi:MAG: hypothetical protein QXE24_02255 [Desulfurococcaceae archaeon]